MPIINETNYNPPFWLFKNHWETIIPSVIRTPDKLLYNRERITTRDGDFLDLDFIYRNNNRIVILSHGLEGHSNKSYMRGMAQIFEKSNWDVLAWNCRSCSEEINLLPKLYHHGATDDLEDVIEHVLQKKYSTIVLVGFSLGGSLVIKYLGENGNNVSKRIKCGVAFSVPCQLGSCAKELSRPDNKLYLNRFLDKLKRKIILKEEQYPDLFNTKNISEISDFYNFDSRYSAPMNGFETAEKFYNYASAGNYIEGIQTPTLLVNSLNDPMFTDDCYPIGHAKDHKYFFLETPKKGGHLGYWWPGRKTSWAEDRTMNFVNEIVT